MCMKQGMERMRPPRTAIPQYLRPSPQNPHPHHHQQQQQQQQQPQSPSSHRRHNHQHQHHHQQPQHQQHASAAQQRLENGYCSPPGSGARQPGVGREDKPHPAKQDQVPVAPYATGLCNASPSPPHRSPSARHNNPDQSPGHPHRRTEGMVNDGATSRHQPSKEQDKHQYHHLQHQQSPPPPQPPVPHDRQSKKHADLNQYRVVPSASVTSPPGPHTPHQPSQAAENYPIRGTMSPLTNDVGGGRAGEGGCGVNGDGGDGARSLSFVFGRPATTGVPGRCASPPSSLPSSLPSSKRPLSPSTRDALPIRRSASGGGAGVVEREVLSTPPVSALSSWWGEGGMVQGGVCCEQCNGCLIDFKRQALRLMFPDSGNGTCLAQTVRLEGLEERLTVPDSLAGRYGQDGGCKVCETQLGQLKQEAMAMIRSIQLAQSAATAPGGSAGGGAGASVMGVVGATNIPALVGSCSTPQHRYGRKGQSYASGHHQHHHHPSMPLAAQAQAYLEHNVRAWMNPKKYQMLAARTATGQCGEPLSPAIPGTSDLSPRTHPYPSSPYASHPYSQGRPPLPGGMYPGSSGLNSSSSLPCSPPAHHSPGYAPRGASPAPSSCASSPPPNSAAVSFFHRAAQKLSKKKKRQQSQEPEPPSYPTSFGQVVRMTPPPAPPCLLRAVGRMQNPGVGKVKVMLRVSAPPGGQGETGSRFLSIDPHRKQITIFDPSASGYVTSANRRTGIAAPKMFAFDAVFSPDDSLTELCAASLSEIVQAVVSGADGCLFTYGYSKTGKSHSMLGSDQSAGTLGVMPCAIAWLFKLINEQKDKTGARFSVRVSAVEVTGKNENLRDLLSDIAQGTEATGMGTAPGVYLREDPICGTQLENQSELRAPSADKAALYLDAALASRAAADEDEARCSHLLFTLNVYQYRIEKANRAGLPGVAGGRSRLHLIDLGSASKSRDPSNVSLSLSALGNVIMALLNGQRHVPHRDSKISQLLRDSLGNVTCRTCMLAHVSSALPHYNETLQVIQLAARIHRMKRRRAKGSAFSSTSSEDSSTDESAKFRRPYRGLRMGTLREDILYSSSHSDPDYTSSSEQSCDTVIYMGANGQSLSDRELTDNEGPPRHVPRTNPRLPRRPSGSRSSGDDSDSGRSRASDGRYTPRPSMGVRAGTPVQGGSPSLARVQSVPHVMSAPGSPNPGHVKIAQRVSTHGKGAIPKSGTGSEASGHWPEKISKHRTKPLDKASEQWIDGPGAAIYPDSKKAGEQWVDGPSAFLVQSEQQQQQPVSTPQSPSHRGDTARRMKNRKVEAEEQWVDGPREMMAGNCGGGGGPGSTPLHTSSKPEPCGRAVVGQPNQGPKLSVAVSERALKQALIKHLEKERPDSTASVDSNTSITAEASDSRPQSMLSSGEGAKVTEASQDCKSSELDRRQAGDGVSVVDVQHQEQSDSVHIESVYSSPHRKHHKDHLSKKVHSSLASPKHSPKASPACSRKVGVDSKATTRLQKSDLPGSASPTHRVAQWIKSVSKSDTAASSTETVQVTSEIPSATDITMTDAETNTEHDSDFERMADSEGSPPPQEGGAETCNNIADASFDSSMETTSRGSETRRDSLYELTVEEQLENLASRKDGNLLAKDVDDETFSSISAREAEDTDREESVLIQHSKVLTEGRQSAKLARHLAAHETSPSQASLDPTFLPELSKPLLSRKPDGASNPHLNREFSEEDVTEQCLGAHFAPAQTDTEVYAATQALFHKDGLASGTPSPNLSAKGSKLAIRSKPPLPQKSSSSSPKTTGLPKPVSVSSSCSSSGPSAGSSATSTPKSISSKDSPLLNKQTSPKGSALPVLSNGHGVRKEKDKNVKCNGSKDKTSTSSSSLNSSPSSIQGKNGSCQKNGSKSASSSSKLPVFGNKSPAHSPSPVPAKDGKLRKKDKDNGKVTRTINGKYIELSYHHHKPRSGNNDSDSGNDSGIVAHEKKLLSPYATVTKPRTPSHSSSGHGSDNSSTISTEVHSQPSSKGDKLHGGTSSGYESMLRESEGTASSTDHEDSGSENSGERKKGSKRKGTKRSRSAPARSSESPSSNGGSQGSRAWAESRHTSKSKEEPMELKKYDMDDVERMQRRRQDDTECRAGDRGRERSKEAQRKQPLHEEGSKPELIDSKDRISMEDGGWGCKFLMCFCKSGSSRGTDV